MEDCIFCRIVSGQIPCEKVYEDESVVAFHDVNPAAPTHVLVIPKEHIEDFMHVKDPNMLTLLTGAAQQIARRLGLEQDGFRLVVNTGRLGGQTVRHLHLHILGGRAMAWPPG